MHGPCRSCTRLMLLDCDYCPDCLADAAGPERYDRDADAEQSRMFDFPTTMRGQTALDTDPR